MGRALAHIEGCKETNKGCQICKQLITPSCSNGEGCQIKYGMSHWNSIKRKLKQDQALAHKQKGAPKRRRIELSESGTSGSSGSSSHGYRSPNAMPLVRGHTEAVSMAEGDMDMVFRDRMNANSPIPNVTLQPLMVAQSPAPSIQPLQNMGQ
ncbi:unnamed protein product, partial [Darwinula stevensoni]